MNAGAVDSIRGNSDHVLSHGHVCPKAFGLAELHVDPDRVRAPLVRTPHGRLEPATWGEAFATIDQRLTSVIERHGPNAVAVYLGNPVAHDFATLLYANTAVRLLGTRNYYTANTVDAMPKFVSSELMFGAMYSVPLPDIDRCSYLLILGANPLVSNGSLLTAPGMRSRLRALQRRGGRIVVVDPNRSRTAQHADQHYPIRPGTDALLLFAIVHVLFDENRTDLGALAPHLRGVDTIESLARDFSPETVAPLCGIPASAIRQLARDLADAPRAAVYGRTGTCTQRFGTLSCWLIDVLNVLTGNLDRPGGALFARPAADLRRAAAQRKVAFGRWHSRVRGLPETLGELPIACLAEEIDTPGEGQVKALITVAGNPARSAPDSARLTAALGQLELLVSLDLYRNETTRHAHVLLPAPSPLTKPHYDLFFGHFAIRNTATFSPPVLPLTPGEIPEWQILLRLIGIITGQGPAADLDAIDDLIADSLTRDANDESAAQQLRGPERLLDRMLRAGPYSAAGEPLTLARLREHPNGIDFGPLQSQLPGLLKTPSGKVELAPAPLVDDVDRLRAAMRQPRDSAIVLIGRRHIRSNNSWMHNLPTLAKGQQRCTLQIHPSDAARLQLGPHARVRSRVGTVDALVEITDAIGPGVVSLPHGWGHDDPEAIANIAGRQPGVNSNALADPVELDPLSGTAILNGIPVDITPIPPGKEAPMPPNIDARQAFNAYADAKNRRDVDALVGLYASDGRYEGAGTSHPIVGHDKLRKFYTRLFKTLPDYAGHFDATMVNDDTAVAWGRMTGTVAGDLMGLPSRRGNRVDVPVVFVCTFRDGQLISDRGYFDTNLLYEQAEITTGLDSGMASFVDRWSRFWADPRDPDRVRELIAPDVALRWPGLAQPLRGADAYVAQLAAAVDRIPDLTLSVVDYAGRGDALTLAWEGNGTIGGEPRRWAGVDRFRLHDGRSAETTVVFDTRAIMPSTAGAS